MDALGDTTIWIAPNCQSLRAGEASGDLERDPAGDFEDCLRDLRRGGDPSLSSGGDLL
jgi:hypothetical protein